MLIDKYTRLYGSFSSNPGNNGSLFFNRRFEETNQNAIYKPFYSKNIHASVGAARVLGMAGFAVSMPFKYEVLQYVDEISEMTQLIGNANTIININQRGYLKAFNTDWMGVRDYFKKNFNIKPSHITIIGKGAFANSIAFYCDNFKISRTFITRENWKDLESLQGIAINATPADIPKGEFNLIDARPHTPEGKEIAKYQAEHQYKLYTDYA